MLLFDGLIALVKEIYLRAEKELRDPEILGRKLVELQTRYEWGEIGEDEYRAEYARLCELLRAAEAENEEEEEEEDEEEKEA